MNTFWSYKYINSDESTNDEEKEELQKDENIHDEEEEIEKGYT